MFYIKFGDNETTLWIDEGNYYLRSMTKYYPKILPIHHSINKMKTSESERQCYINTEYKPGEWT